LKLEPLSQNKKSRAERAAAEKRKQKAAVRRDAGGRVHLQLQEDRTTGRRRLVLQEPIFESEWQNQIATATANTAFGTLRDQPSVSRAVELARDVMTVASGLTDELLGRLPAGTIACKPGCDHCCHQVVGVTPPEALAIVEHLHRKLDQAELARVAARVADAHARADGLTSAERFSPAHPCPFLDAGQCSIYEVRPLACRGMNSRDAAGCAERLRDPATRAEAHANVLGGHSFVEPIRAFIAISAGLQLSLREVYALDSQPLELTAIVHLLLSGPASLAAQWIGGFTPFESARADADSEAKTRALAGMLE
jgi:Fe-S-cluster containining protein